MTDKLSQDELNRTIELLRENQSDLVFIKRKCYSLSELSKLSGDALFALLSVRPGMKLYKYCSFGKNAKNNILKGEVHLSNPNTFDDAFDSTSDADEFFFINFRLMRYLSVLECNFDWELDNHDLTRMLYSRLGECGDTFEAFKDYLIEKKIDEITSSRLQTIYLSVLASGASGCKAIDSALINEFQEYMQKHQRYRVSCFTTDPKNIKMWSLYANNNKGICIEYTVPTDPALLVLSVAYSHRRGDFNYLTATNDIYDVDVFAKRLFESVLRKDVSWIEQDEYRLLCSVGEHEGDQCRFFPITAVYMGNKMTRRNQSQVRRICKEVGADCYYVQRSLSTFELFPKKIML